MSGDDSDVIVMEEAKPAARAVDLVILDSDSDFGSADDVDCDSESGDDDIDDMMDAQKLRKDFEKFKEIAEKKYDLAMAQCNEAMVLYNAAQKDEEMARKLAFAEGHASLFSDLLGAAEEKNATLKRALAKAEEKKAALKGALAEAEKKLPKK